MEEEKIAKIESKEETRAKKVVSGTAREIKDKPLSQKIKDMFFPGDATSIKDFLILDIIVPTFKRAISDSVNIWLFNDTAPRGSNSRVPAQRVSYRTDYNGMSNPNRATAGSRSRQSTFDYNNIEFETRGDAEATLHELDEIIEAYDAVSVFDLYQAAGLDCDYTANKWGWYDIRGVEAVRTRNGCYMLKFPRPVTIK